MEIYLVGGAVRDALLGCAVRERDWVVVGATAEELMARGFKAVGKDFPVFLHPDTGEEYALARTERKSGKGYKGFIIYASTEVTLEQDLLRRDLTINAMAQALDGRLIDPFHGQQDCNNRILRHVSEAFVEDPLRVLRVARLSARFASLGFRIAPETMVLMQRIAQSGELLALTPERIFKEWEKSLQTDSPAQFIITLLECHAFQQLFDYLPAESMITHLTQAAQGSPDPIIRFGLMLSDATQNAIQRFCTEYKIPTSYKNLALMINRYHEHFSHFKWLNSQEIFSLLKATDAFRQSNRFRQLLTAVTIKYPEYQQQLSDFFATALKAAAQVNPTTLIEQGLSGTQLGMAIEQARIAAIKPFNVAS